MHRFSSPPAPLLPLHDTPPPRTPPAPIRLASPRSPRTSAPSSRSPRRPTSAPRPPPIAQLATDETTRDELRALARQAQHLERRLQASLDAQSAGLLAGLGLEAADAPPSTATSPPRAPHSAAARSPGSHRGSPAAPFAPPALPAARRAIHTTLLELAALKTHEATTLAAALAPLDAFLDNAAALATTQAGLAAHLAAPDGTGDNDDDDDDDDAKGDRALAAQERDLQQTIAALEDELATQRAQLRALQARRQGAASRRAAQRSSWRAAAADVDQRIRAEVLSGAGLPARQPDPRREDVWALPPSRRTLALVRDGVAADRAAVASQQAAAAREAAACREGAAVWAGAVGAVRGVERALAEAVRAQSPASSSPVVRPRETLGRDRDRSRSSRSHSHGHGHDHGDRGRKYDGDGDDDGDGDAESAGAQTAAADIPLRPLGSDGSPLSPRLPSPMAVSSTAAAAAAATAPLRAVLTHMDTAAEALAADVALAAARGWRLLVVAVGAELAALREGRGLLGGLAGGASALASATGRAEDAEDQGIELAELAEGGTGSVVTAAAEASAAAEAAGLPPLMRGDTEDDGPGLDLLVETG